MGDKGTLWARPRGQAWGNEAQRAVLHAIAEDVASRSGHRVAAIEALRTDGNLEFVAIAGNPGAREQLLGEASPFELARLTDSGVDLMGWLHIPSERLDDLSRDWLVHFGHTPDVPPSGLPNSWHAEDQLVRLLKNDEGEIRALLYLDEPHSSLRPTRESVAAINDEVGALFDAIVSIVERELYGEQVRMLTQARTAMQSLSPGMGVTDTLRELSDAMVEVMAVDAVDLFLAESRVPDLEPHTEFFEDHMRRVWLQRGHVVVEPTQTWGIPERHAVPTPGVLRRLMNRRGLASWMLVPIGMGDEYLGTMGLGRAPGGGRWVDSEINAADAVASDLASLVLDSRLRERERTLNATLLDLADQRRDMVNTLAHELRTPVTVQRMHLDLLAEEPDAEIAEKAWVAIDRSARRIEDVIEDLMTLAEVGDSNRSLSLSSVDLSSMVRDACDFLAPVATSSGVVLEMSVVDDLVVTGSQSGLHQVVGNLVSNAVKYTPSGGRVMISLTPSEAAERAGILLSCTDTGIGISPDDLEHVFTPFFRSGNPQTRDRPGTGLGLSIIDQVVTRHGGTIAVHSELGAGTIFSVWLPLAADSDAEEQ